MRRFRPLHSYMFLHFLSLLLIFLTLTGCTTQPTPLKPMYSYNDFIYQGKNNFYASPRKVIVNNNELFISFDNGDIVKWNLTTQKLLQVFKKESFATNRALSYSNSGLYIGSSDMTLYHLNDNFNLITKKRYFKGSIFNIQPFKKYLFVAFGDASIGIVNKKDLKLLSSYREHLYLVYSLYLDEKNNFLYTGSDDNTIIKWKITQDSKLKKIKLIHDFKSAIRNIIKLKNHYIVTTGNGSLYLYNKEFNLILDKKEQKNNIVSALYYKDILYTGNTKGEIYLYKIRNNSFQINKNIKLDSVIRSIVKINSTSILILSKNGKTLLLKLKDKV